MADRSSSKRPDVASDAAAGSTGKSDGDQAPGLGEQVGRTKGAVFGLIRSHVDLARAEFSEIADQVKRAAALGGIALLLLFMTGMLIAVGIPLFLGQVLFGSIGWGVLIGAELLIATAVLLVFAIIDLSWARAFSSLVVAVAVGVVIFGLLTAVGSGHRVAAAVGVAALLLVWPIVAAVFVFRHGIDTAKLRKRFVPDVTIETTKETIEWVREQMPLGRKS